MDAPVPLIAVALLAAAAVLAPTGRARALAMLAALALTPAILISHIADTEQFRTLTDRPGLLAALSVAGVVVVAALAVLFHRRPDALPVAAVFALPFRIPIAVGGSTSNLLVPLYLVVGAGALAYAVPRLRARHEEAGAGERGPGALEWALMALVALYAVQASYSDDFDHALEQVVFFYVPFALLFVLVSRVRWTARLAAACLAVLAGLALVFVGIGFWEYATRTLLLNPKVLASNQFEDYFRVNSLFFDPNIYGRFLVVVMLGLAGALLWTVRTRTGVLAGVLLAALWAGLVLTFSQSSFGALLVGLAVLAALRWRAAPTLAVAAAAVAIGAAVVVVAPDEVRFDVGSSESFDSATSGRYELIEGGVSMFADKPVFGWGSGSFAREYRRRERTSEQRATSASHTIPVTVAAEQGVGGLLLYLAVLALAFRCLFAGARRLVVRAAVAAAFTALVFHTLLYAAFLEDPLMWALLGFGVALARAGAPEGGQAPPAGT